MQNLIQEWDRKINIPPDLDSVSYSGGAFLIGHTFLTQHHEMLWSHLADPPVPTPDQVIFARRMITYFFSDFERLILRFSFDRVPQTLQAKILKCSQASVSDCLALIIEKIEAYKSLPCIPSPEEFGKMMEEHRAFGIAFWMNWYTTQNISLSSRNLGVSISTCQCQYTRDQARLAKDSLPAQIILALSNYPRYRRASKAAEVWIAEHGQPFDFSTILD